MNGGEQLLRGGAEIGHQLIDVPGIFTVPLSDLLHSVVILQHLAVHKPQHRLCALNQAGHCTEYSFRDLLNLRNRLARGIGQLADLLSHHSESPARIAGSGRFDRRIERQQIGLGGNIQNGAGQHFDFGNGTGLLYGAAQLLFALSIHLIGLAS
ncbi:hypothetical protein D3C73_1220480 [compost metagenome]